MNIRPLIRDRIKAVLRLAFGKNDNSVGCSFCGRGTNDGRDVIAGPGVAICTSCAAIASDYSITKHIELADDEEAVAVTIFEEPACLLPGLREKLDRDLRHVCETHSCSLVGWGYGCGLSDGFSDRISAWVKVPKENRGDDFEERFRQAYLGIGHYNQLTDGQASQSF